MTVVLTALDNPAPGLVTCDSLSTITPNDAYSNELCPVVNKTRSIIIDQGQSATVRWEMRDRNGNPVNLQNCVDAGSLVFARIINAITSCSDYIDVECTIHDAERGLVDLVIPSSIYQTAGIYTVQFGMLSSVGNVQFVDKGWLSVERGLFGAATHDYVGPITLGEIRIQLRDFAISNSLRGVVEFDDTELIHSIIRPVREWNETPPLIGSYSAANFPFHEHWLKAVCANLLLIASHWYRRNKLRVSHGGAQDDDKNRDADYESAAMRLRQEWLAFMRAQKQVLNFAAAYGSMI